MVALKKFSRRAPHERRGDGDTVSRSRQKSLQRLDANDFDVVDGPQSRGIVAGDDDEQHLPVPSATNACSMKVLAYLIAEVLSRLDDR